MYAEPWNVSRWREWLVETRVEKPAGGSVSLSGKKHNSIGNSPLN